MVINYPNYHDYYNGLWKDIFVMVIECSNDGVLNKIFNNYYLLFIIYYLLFIIYYLIIYYLLFIIYYLLFITYYLLFIVY